MIDVEDKIAMASSSQLIATKNDSSSATNQHSGFLSLIPELRNRIYEFVFWSTDPLTISRKLTQPSLTVTCQQLRAESLPWFYTRNVLTITVENGNLSELVGWALMVGRVNLLMIRNNGVLRIETKYTSLFDMPVGAGVFEWDQPFTKTIEETTNMLFERHMQRDKVSREETGRMVLDILLEPGKLEQLGWERMRGSCEMGALQSWRESYGLLDYFSPT